MIFGCLVAGNIFKKLPRGRGFDFPSMSPYTTMATRNTSNFINFQALFSWPAQRATTTTAATTAAEEFSQAIQAPSPTHPGTTYPVRVSPHSDVTAPIVGIGVRGYIGKLLLLTYFFDLFVQWDLGLIRIVENLRAGSRNISSYRGVHSESFFSNFSLMSLIFPMTLALFWFLSITLA